MFIPLPIYLTVRNLVTLACLLSPHIEEACPFFTPYLYLWLEIKYKTERELFALLLLPLPIHELSTINTYYAHQTLPIYLTKLVTQDYNEKFGSSTLYFCFLNFAFSRSSNLFCFLLPSLSYRYTLYVRTYIEMYTSKGALSDRWKMKKGSK